MQPKMPLSYLILIAALLQNPAIREKQQEPTEHKREIPKQPPAATEKPIVPNSPLPTEKQKNSKEQSKSWPPPGPWDIYWPTLGLVIATGFAVRYAMRTVRAIKNQVDEMKKTAVQTDAMIHEATQ